MPEWTKHTHLSFAMRVKFQTLTDRVKASDRVKALSRSQHDRVMATAVHGTGRRTLADLLWSNRGNQSGKCTATGRTSAAAPV